MKQVGEDVTFQRRVHHHAMEGRLGFERFENLKDEAAEEAGVVAAIGEGSHFFKPLLGAFVLLSGEDGLVEILLAREVAEQDRFADLGGGGDVAGFGSAEAVFRKQIHGDAKKLAAAVDGRDFHQVSTYLQTVAQERRPRQ